MPFPFPGTIFVLAVRLANTSRRPSINPAQKFGVRLAIMIAMLQVTMLKADNVDSSSCTTAVAILKLSLNLGKPTPFRGLESRI